MWILKWFIPLKCKCDEPDKNCWKRYALRDQMNVRWDFKYTPGNNCSKIFLPKFLFSVEVQQCRKKMVQQCRKWKLCSTVPKKWLNFNILSATNKNGAVQQCRSTTVPKMKKCSTVPKIDDFRHCWTINLFSALLYFGTVEHPSKSATAVPKYKSAEKKFIVQQCQKSSIFGTVEHFLNFGTFVLRHCWTLPFQHIKCDKQKLNGERLQS